MAIAVNPEEYDVGDIAVITGDLKVNGILVNPTAIECRMLKPDGTVVDVPINAAGGEFEAEYQIEDEGMHYYRVTATGAAAASEERGFMVRERRVGDLPA